jgi:hypothetical protein
VKEAKKTKQARALNKKEKIAQKRREKAAKKKEELARTKKTEKEKEYVDIKVCFEVDDDENDKNYKNKSVRAVVEECEGNNSAEILQDLIDCIDEGQEHEVMQQPRHSERVRKRRN